MFCLYMGKTIVVQDLLSEEILRELKNLGEVQRLCRTNIAHNLLFIRKHFFIEILLLESTVPGTNRSIQRIKSLAEICLEETATECGFKILIYSYHLITRCWTNAGVNALAGDVIVHHKTVHDELRIISVSATSITPITYENIFFVNTI